jgi:hypothetical protein
MSRPSASSCAPPRAPVASAASGLLDPGSPAATLERLLARPGLSVRRHDDQWIAAERRRGVSVAVGAFDMATVQTLVAAGLARTRQDGEATLLVARAPGEPAGDDAGEAPRAGLRTDAPLEALARRKDVDGRPLIDVAALEAGRRFHGDFRRAGLSPRVGMNWSGVVVDRATSTRGLDLTEQAAEARQRVHRALDAMGPELSGAVIDLCAFEKGLEEIERDRRWPVRSAKVVVGIGLAVLARHYGLQAEARGRPRVRSLL